MKKAVIILVLLLTGCGARVDLGEFAPYVQEFQHQGQIRGFGDMQLVSLVIKRADLTMYSQNSDVTEGVCIPGDFFTPTRIYVERVSWPYLNEYQRKALLFHELGHCILLRDHKNDVDQFGAPVSIMNKYVIWNYFNAATYQKYVDELFFGK